MKEVTELLNSPFIINEIVIKNFSVLGKDVGIEINIISEKHSRMKYLFENVSRININSEYYGCSEQSSIIIEDCSDLGWENIKYKIFISEDIMTFYCNNILIEDFEMDYLHL